MLYEVCMCVFVGSDSEGLRLICIMQYYLGMGGSNISKLDFVDREVLKLVS